METQHHLSSVTLYMHCRDMHCRVANANVLAIAHAGRARAVSYQGISTELEFNEQVGRAEQCEASLAETSGVASIVFIQKGHQNVYRPLILGSSEPALAPVHCRSARNNAESPFDRQEGQQRSR